MANHPFTLSVWRKTAGISAALLLAVLMCMLLTTYGKVLLATAAADSLLDVGALAIAAYFYWYVIGFFRVFQSQVVVALTVQLFCLAAGSLLIFLRLEELQTFVNLIPIRLSIGVLSWIIVQQWYFAVLVKQQTLDEKRTAEKKEKKSTTTCTKETGEVLDRISVKDGAKIHIIQVEEILYIQAYGDYVVLFTTTGKYVKELTMKFLEASLPNLFIRIHRSHIVNTSCIVRIELFGKETYQLRLKNNTCLRMSSSGYKLLKDKLLL